jgi:hypothetical protein
MFGRGFYTHTVIYSVCIRFCPTLQSGVHEAGSAFMHEAGSAFVHEAGTAFVHEAGSVFVHEAGSASKRV